MVKRKKQLSWCLTKYKYRGAEVQLHAFLTSVLDGDKWSIYAPSVSAMGKTTDTCWTGGWMIPGIGLDFGAKRRNKTGKVYLREYREAWQME
jgi:hypothetical protein